MARLTKQQKADLAASETKALAGHYVPVLGAGEPVVQTIDQDLADPDAGIKSGILNGIDQAVEEATRQFTLECVQTLAAIEDGVVASITGDGQRGFIRHGNKDHRNLVVKALFDNGLLAHGWAGTIPTALYYLKLTDAGLEYLHSTD